MDMSQSNAAALEPGTDHAWQALLDAYDVRFVILDVQRDRGWQQSMRRQPGWKVDTEDEHSVLYARSAKAGGDCV